MATDMQNGAFRHNNMAVPDGQRVMPLFSLKGRTAIVSGAGAGIGLAVAQGLAEAGANVAIWYNSNKQALAEAEKIETTYGVKCMYKVPWAANKHMDRTLTRIVQAAHTKSTSPRPRPWKRPSTTL